MSSENVCPLSVRLLRWTIWCEIALILATLGFGVLENYHDVLAFLLVPLVFLTYAGMLSLFAVPPVLLVLALSSDLEVWQRLAAFVLAIALPFAHFVVLAPLL